MKKMLHLIIIIFLTIVTQIGGVIYLLTILMFRQNRKFRYLKQGIVFVLLYLIATFLIVPYIAPVFGRERVKETKFVEIHTVFTKLFNRNYVKPKLNQVLEEISMEMNNQHNGIKVICLDANFPFIDHFPLLPHLSHNDGKKIDLSFVYEKKNGVLTNQKPSFSGYGVFVEPVKGELNQTEFCKDRGFWQYDFSKYLTFGRINDGIRFSENATKDLINIIVKQNNIGKVFIEPNLKKRLGLKSDKIRFQGCRSVRHDDHIHIQLK